jgi:hypothetical protein
MENQMPYQENFYASSSLALPLTGLMLGIQMQDTRHDCSKHKD